MNTYMSKNVKFVTKSGNDIYVDMIDVATKHGSGDKKLLCFDFDDTLVKGKQKGIAWHQLSNDDSSTDKILTQLVCNGQQDLVKKLFIDAQKNSCGVAIVTFNESIKSVARTLEYWFGAEVCKHLTIVCPSLSRHEYREYCVKNNDKSGLIEYLQEMYGVQGRDQTVTIDDKVMNLNSVKHNSQILLVEENLTNEKLNMLNRYIVQGVLIDDSKLITELSGVAQPIQTKKSTEIVSSFKLIPNKIGGSFLKRRSAKSLVSAPYSVDNSSIAQRRSNSFRTGATSLNPTTSNTKFAEGKNIARDVYEGESQVTISKQMQSVEFSNLLTKEGSKDPGR